MFMQVLKYKDFDEKDQEVTFGFNVNEAEAMILETMYPEGLSARLKKIVESDDKHAMVTFFRDLLLMSVGKRVGPLFLKTIEIKEEFEFTNALPAMFLVLTESEDIAKQFIHGILPKESTIPKTK